MNEREKAELVEDYLGRLSRGLQDVHTSSRQELMEDVRRHIDEAWAESPDHSRVALLNILDRLGEPEDLIREERERLTPGSEANLNLDPTLPLARRRKPTWPMMLVLLLAVLSLSVIWTTMLRPRSPSEQVPLAEVVAGVKAGRIESIRARQDSPEIVVKYDDGREVRSHTPDQVNILEVLQNNGVDISSGKPQIEIHAPLSSGDWFAAISFILPSLLSMGIITLGIVLIIRLLRRQSTQPRP